MFNWEKLAIAAVAAIGLVGVTAQQSVAAPVTITFTGTVSFVSAGVSSAFAAGDTLTGSYTFESTTPARAGSNSDFAVFDALTALSFTINGYNGTTTGAPEIQIDDPAGGPDRYGVVARASDGLTGASVNGNALFAFGFRLDDSTGAVYSDALVLPGAVTLGDFDSNSFFVFFNGFSESVSGSLTSIRVTGVPEPASLMLLGVSALAIGLAARRRRSLP